MAIMRHTAPENPLARTPASTASESSSSSVKSASHSLDHKKTKSSLKSILRTSRSTASLHAVRFSVPEPPPVMPALELDAPLSPRKDGSISSECQPQPRTSLDIPAGPPARMSLHKRLSAPAPISRRQSQSFNTPPSPPSPFDSRIYSHLVGRSNHRVTSFQSVASAPTVLQFPATPSDPPSQYNPLQHYLPCLAPDCRNHYTTLLLGPTFYFLQSPYQLIRKRGLCPLHAHQDLKLANQRAKSTYECMRQNCGRKTLGAIAAEFEVYLRQVREERAEESKRMKVWQKQRVLPSALSGVTKGKKGGETWGEEWDWRFSQRPCTKKGCEGDWYSPFDNRLYLFYTTPRPSGLVPLRTMCPSCAKDDVQTAEERIEGRRRDVGGLVGPEWGEWYVQVAKDRLMEIEFWENAQERIVREEMGKKPAAEVQPKKTVKEKSKRLTKLGVCVVM